jgi:hypothetical protein
MQEQLDQTIRIELPIGSLALPLLCHLKAGERFKDSRDSGLEEVDED